VTTTLAAATASHHASLVSSRAAALVGELIRHLLTHDPETSPALLARIEDAVHTYETEFRGYLNGQRQRPPVELGAVLKTVFVELAPDAGARTASCFRVETLEARFHAAERLLTQRLERGDRHLPSRAERSA
jgi:hypothetical protein